MQKCLVRAQGAWHHAKGQCQAHGGYCLGCRGQYPTQQDAATTVASDVVVAAGAGPPLGGAFLRVSHQAVAVTGKGVEADDNDSKKIFRRSFVLGEGFKLYGSEGPRDLWSPLSIIHLSFWSKVADSPCGSEGPQSRSQPSCH